MFEDFFNYTNPNVPTFGEPGRLPGFTGDPVSVMPGQYEGDNIDAGGGWSPAGSMGSAHKYTQAFMQLAGGLAGDPRLNPRMPAPPQAHQLSAPGWGGGGQPSDEPAPFYNLTALRHKPKFGGFF